MIRTAHPATRRNITLSGLLGKQSTLLPLAALLVGGILLGRYGTSVLGGAVSDTAYQLVAGYSMGNIGQSLFETYIATFSSSFVLLLGLFFCAYCAIAAPMILGTLFSWGVGIGVCYSAIFSLYGMEAFWYVAIILLPNAVITALILLRASNFSLQYSRHIWRSIFGKTVSECAFSGQDICVKFVIFTVILALSTALYAITTRFFGQTLFPGG